MGLIIFNPHKFSGIMKRWFLKYDRSVSSITNGGDQTHLNYEIQNASLANWIEYSYQAIWVYEMAWYYPELYLASKGNEIKKRVTNAIESTLYRHDFLHFAGSWNESKMLKVASPFIDNMTRRDLSDYMQYLSMPVSGQPVGYLRPGE